MECGLWLAGGGELATGGDVTLVLERGQVNVPDPVGTRDLIYLLYVYQSTGGTDCIQCGRGIPALFFMHVSENHHHSPVKKKQKELLYFTYVNFHVTVLLC